MTSSDFNKLQSSSKNTKTFKKINDIVNAKKWHFSQKFAVDKKVLNPFSQIERKSSPVIAFLIVYRPYKNTF